MAHRFLGVLLAFAVVGACLRFRQRALAVDRIGLAKIAKIPMFLVAEDGNGMEQFGKEYLLQELKEFRVQ